VKGLNFRKLANDAVPIDHRERKVNRVDSHKGAHMGVVNWEDLWLYNEGDLKAFYGADTPTLKR
jgi:hypothetical protein